MSLSPDELRNAAKTLRTYADRYDAIAASMESSGVGRMDFPNGPSYDQGMTRIRVHVGGVERAWERSQMGLPIDELSTADVPIPQRKFDKPARPKKAEKHG